MGNKGEGKLQSKYTHSTSVMHEMGYKVLFGIILLLIVNTIKKLVLFYFKDCKIFMVTLEFDQNRRLHGNVKVPGDNFSYRKSSLSSESISLSSLSKNMTTGGSVPSPLSTAVSRSLCNFLETSCKPFLPTSQQS